MPRGRKATTPWTVYIRDSVRTRDTPYLELLHHAASLVPPGRGYRHGLAASDSVQKHRGKRAIQMETDAAIRRGQRAIAYNAIRLLIRNQRIEIYEDDGVKMVRQGLVPLP